MLMRLFWPLSIVIAWLVVRWAVPAERIKKFAFHGFVCGFLLALVHNYLWVVVLHLWSIQHLLIPIIPFPLAVLTYWWGAVIIQDHLLIELKLNRWVLLGCFAITHAVTVQLLVGLGFIGFHKGWTFWHTLALAYGYQWIMYLFLAQWFEERMIRQ